MLLSCLAATLSRSSDGGDTWTSRQLTQAANNITGNGRQDCWLRTDSNGVVYGFSQGGIHSQNAIFMARSFDGGAPSSVPSRSRCTPPAACATR